MCASRCASATRAAARASPPERRRGDARTVLTGLIGGREVFGGALCTTGRGRRRRRRVAASLGCGVPTAVADLREGETVLDLGSGAGADVLHLGPARRSGGPGDRPGHDRRDARARARATPSRRVSRTSSSCKGYIEEIPLPDASVDVVISNCVINLSADKPRVLREVARVLRPGGRFADLRRDRRRGHGRGHPRRHAAVDRLHRRGAHARGVRRSARRRRPRRRRDPRDPSRPRARRRGDHPRAQARRAA